MYRKTTSVALIKSTYKNVRNNLSRAFDLLKCLPSRSDNIVIKINLCDARTPDSGVITHPLLLDALLNLLRERFGYETKITIVESDGGVAIPDLFIKWFGFMKIIKKWDARFSNLSKEEVLFKESGGNVLKKVPVPRIMADSDFFITMPKVKTMPLTKITCCLKNQFGCLPTRNKARYHKVIHEVIAEINKVMRPDLCVADGIISHVGPQGPTFGKPLCSNLLIIGRDPVAVDCLVSKLLGFRPTSIKHIKRSHNLRVGSMHYKLVGDFKNLPRIYKANYLEWLLYSIGTLLKSRQTRQEDIK